VPQDTRLEKTGEKLPQFRSVALVALGSNYPVGSVDATETIQLGMEAIQTDLGVIRGKSNLYRTPAFPPGSGPDFVNAAIVLATNLAADDLLEGLHRIETALGRVRRKRWEPRSLDLDLIAFDDLVLPDRQTFFKWADMPLEQQMQAAPEYLILPHPRMADRAFVLLPLLDIAPDWVHPVLHLSVREMADRLPEDRVSEVKLL
jgi:2-amino-4-hydroxy-6-hydroxymethyldihydropteridine diphosphokinase